MKATTLFLLISSCLLASCEAEPLIPEQITIVAPTNMSPANDVVFKTAFIDFSWDSVAHATEYELWLDSTENFEDPIMYFAENNAFTPLDSLPNNTYYWKVKAENDSIQGSWSGVQTFTVDVEIIEENIILVPGAEVKNLSTSQQYIFLEGPAFDGDKMLYFSDIQNEKINVYNVQTKSFQVFRAFSNKCNGLMFNVSGQLIACEGGTGKVVAINAEGMVEETLAEKYNDVRFNSPNDLVIDSEGGIYFTDPTWGEEPQGVKGVYYIAVDGNISRLVDDMDKPNGVIFSPNGSRLYINDSNSKTVRVYTVDGPGVLSAEFIAITLKSNSGNNTGADGMAMDVKGNLYVTTAMGIQVFDKDLEYLLTIDVPETPANCTFGGEDLKTLYITARTNLYSLDLNNSGVTFPLN